MAEPEEIQPQQKRTSWRVWALGIAVLLAIIFIAENAQKVKVDFLFVSTTTPLVVALLISVALGALIGWLGPRVRRHERD